MKSNRYLLKYSNGYFYYRRRVPSRVAELVPEKEVKVSLETKDEETAQKKRDLINANFEAMWDDIIVNGGDHYDRAYAKATKIAKINGFSYLLAEDILEKGVGEIVARTKKLSKLNLKKSKSQAEALLGLVEKPPITLGNVFEKFKEISANEFVKKSEQQKRKWENPRRAAIDTFREVVGNKPLAGLTREDVLKFRAHNIKRYEEGKIGTHTVNKYIERARMIITRVDRVLGLQLNTKQLFEDVLIKEIVHQRPSYDIEYVRDVLLDMENFKGLNEEARLVLPIMANTGMRPSEICGLDAEDIYLNADIPYIHVRPKDDLELKTQQSQRQIPIIGASLWAFQQAPSGFKRYKRNTDSLSACINKYLREHNMRPSAKHTLYSIRHTFQDMLRIHQIDERVQAELMGHRYDLRAKYGAPTLQEKLNAISKFAFEVKL